MADTSAKTFPGVYTQIIDQSFLTPQQSRFRPGLVGVASKGPFDTPTVVKSLKEFVQVFGQPIAAAVDALGMPNGNTGFYLADAVAMAADYTNQMTIVRVGNRYVDFGLHDGSGMAGGFTLGTSNDASVYSLLNAEPMGELYLKIHEAGKVSTTNAKVDTAGGGTIALSTTTDALQADYTNATISYSKFDGAANNAEAILYAYSYGSDAAQLTDLKLTTFGTVTGSKNAFQFDVQSNPLSLEVGSVYKIKSDTSFKAETPEVRVKQVLSSTAYLETSDITRLGYQALALQETYTASAPAYLYKATGRVPFLWLRAKTAGEWANGQNLSQGLYVRVRPGSAPGSKKLEIFENGGLVETLDNIQSGINPDTGLTYYEDAIANSQYIEVVLADTTEDYHAANTAAPWDSAYYGTNASLPKSMPTGAVNAGILTYAGTVYNTGDQFLGGYNGNNVQEIDFLGAYDPVTDTLTGLKALEDIDTVDVNIIMCPMDLSAFTVGGLADTTSSGIAVMQEMARVAKKINAFALADVPPGLNSHDAVDWHNGTGLYTGRPRIDDPNLGIAWNWGNITDRFTGLAKWVPPTVGVIRCIGITFQRDKPWYAFAGETRGWIPEFNAVQYPRVSNDSRQAMYGNGNSVNPILKIQGRYFFYGERTLQRAESKLTAIHNVILVNYVVTGLADIGRRFVFDPNDLELLVHIRLGFSEFLDKVKNERGLEDYELVVDDRNNTADTRNRREVIIDLALIPTDVAERIFINATVRESGAQLNTVNA